MSQTTFQEGDRVRVKDSATDPYHRGRTGNVTSCDGTGGALVKQDEPFESGVTQTFYPFSWLEPYFEIGDRVRIVGSVLSQGEFGTVMETDREGSLDPIKVEKDSGWWGLYVPEELESVDEPRQHADYKADCWCNPEVTESPEEDTLEEGDKVRITVNTYPVGIKRSSPVEGLKGTTGEILAITDKSTYDFSVVFDEIPEGLTSTRMAFLREDLELVDGHTFKVGDKVKVVGKEGPVAHGHSVGSVGEVVGISSSGNPFVQVGTLNQYVSAKDLAPAQQDDDRGSDEQSDVDTVDSLLTEAAEYARKGNYTSHQKAEDLLKIARARFDARGVA